MARTTIVLADSEYLIRVGLQHLLLEIDDFEVLGEATNERQLLRLLEHQQPCLVILDHNQASHFSERIVDAIKEQSPATNLLIISADENKQRIEQLIQSGINSYLTKKCSRDEIIDAIRATARGEKFFCKKVMNYILQKSFGNPAGTAAASTTATLSAREKEIVSLIAQGRIAKEIAEQLHLSPHTIYTHRKNIMKKLQLSSASELVLYAANQGLV